MAEPRPQVTVIGTGLIATAVAARFGGTAVNESDAQVVRGPVILATDGWVDLTTARSRERARGPKLSVHTELDKLVIGPWEVGRQPACMGCAQRRYHRGHRDEQAVRDIHAAQLAAPAPLLTAAAAELAATLIEDDVSSDAAHRTPRCRNAQITVDLDELTIAVHHLLADPACPDCGLHRRDRPDHALAAANARARHHDGSFRGRDLSAGLEQLKKTYVDERIGVVRRIWDQTAGSQILSVAEQNGGGSEGSGFGIAPRRRGSQTTAILEALERAAAVPRGRWSGTDGAYHDLRDRALDPRSVGLHPPEAYAEPGFRYAPFDPQRPYRWVWGWSFRRDAPILVPRSLAFYGDDPGGPDGAGFVYEISNGCAVGSSLPEAVLYGVIEVAERDAFLLAWYAQLPRPEIDTATFDAATKLQLAALRAETGYAIRLFDITTEQGIPAVLAMATAPPGTDSAAVRVATGAHLTGGGAVRAALAELGGSLARAINAFSDPDAVARAAAMVDDPWLVRTMGDHGLLYCHPRAAARLRFLTDLAPSQPVGRVGEDVDDLSQRDLDRVMRVVVGRYLCHGMDVVAVDQTTDELRSADLHCVKVLIPGTLSMTFGHRYRRVNGLSRVLTARQRLGLADRPLRVEQLNPHPHPFP